MSHCLVIFTSTFPAGHMDTFILDELPYLSAQFDHIRIFPVNAVGSLPRPPLRLPENCDYRLTNKRCSLLGRLRDVCYMGKTLFSKDTPFRTECRQQARGLRRKLFLLYFEGRAKQAAADIQPHLQPLFETYDQVTFYSYWLYVACRAMLLAGEALTEQYPDKPVSFYARAHGYDLYEDVNGLDYLPYRKWFLHRLDGIFPCSAHGVRYFLQRHAGSEQERAAARVWLARLGTAEPAVLAAGLTPDEKQELAAYKGEEDVCEIVSCAWIRPVKRMDLLIDALKGLREKTTVRWRWTHFGDAEKADDFEAVRRRAEAELDFMEVRLEGVRSKAYIMAYYLQERPSLFVNCSSSEGVPVSVMEALSAGIPVYATDVGGTAEVTGREGTGRLWPPDVSAAQMSEDLYAFARLPEPVRAGLRENAVLRWKELASAGVNYPQFAAILSGQMPARDVPVANVPDLRMIADGV